MDHEYRIVVVVVWFFQSSDFKKLKIFELIQQNTIQNTHTDNELDLLLLLLDDFIWLLEIVAVRFVKIDELSFGLLLLVTINLPANPSLNEDDCCWLLFDVLRLIACSVVDCCFCIDDCCCCCIDDDFDFDDDDNFCDCNDNGNSEFSRHKRSEYLHNASPEIPSSIYLAKYS